MIKATVLEARTAFFALRRVSATPLGAKAAWRVSRLIGKLKSVVLDFEEQQRKHFLDAGGVVEGNGISIKDPVRNGQDDAEWADVMAKHKANIEALTAKMADLDAEVVEIDYDSIPIELFGDAKVSANDLADAGPFLSE